MNSLVRLEINYKSQMFTKIRVESTEHIILLNDTFFKEVGIIHFTHEGVILVI